MGVKSSKQSYNVEQLGQNVKSRESLKRKDVDEKHLPFVAASDTVIEEIISAVQKSEEAPRLSREELKKEEDLIIAKVRGEIITSENSNYDVTSKEDAKTNNVNDLDAITIIKEEISESVPIVTVQSILEAEKARAEEKMENHASINETEEEKIKSNLDSDEMKHFPSRKIEDITNITCVNEVNTYDEVEDDQTKSTKKIEEHTDNAPVPYNNNTEIEERITTEEITVQKTINKIIEEIEPICNHQLQPKEEEINLHKVTEPVVDINEEKQEEEIILNKSTQSVEVNEKKEDINSHKTTELVVEVNEKEEEDINSHKTTELVVDENEEKQEKATAKEELQLPRPIEIIDIASQIDKKHNEIHEKLEVDKDIIQINNNVSVLKKDEPEEICNNIKSQSEINKSEKEEAVSENTKSDEAPAPTGNTDKKEEKTEENQLTPKEAYLKQILDTEKIVNGMKEKILHFSGSAEDKEFSVLHEELIKHIIYLDDIAFNDEEVKSERRRVIKMIQQCVQNLEKKIEGSDDDDHPSDTE